jgi:hypothetical protein
VAGCCECGVEPSGSGATELVGDIQVLTAVSVKIIDSLLRLARMRKEAVMIYSKSLSQCLPRSGYLVFISEFEPRTSQI